MQSWVDVAVLARTYNLEGGFVARPAADLPFLLQEGMEVALVPPQIDAPRRVTVEAVDQRSDGSAVVFFNQVTDASTAGMLCGCHCLVARSEVEDLLPLRGADHPWAGWTVEDEREGLVGSVSSIEDVPGQSRLVVDRPSGAQALIPLVDELIVCVDEEARVIRTQLPAGLLDL